MQGNYREKPSCFLNPSSPTNWTFLSQLKEMLLPLPILAYRHSFKKNSVRPSNIDSSHPRMVNSILIRSNAGNVNTESLLTSKCFKSLDRVKQTK